jgi:hypothetical protein
MYLESQRRENRRKQKEKKNRTISRREIKLQREKCKVQSNEEKRSVLEDDVDVVVSDDQVDIFHNIFVFEGFEKGHFILELSFVESFTTRDAFYCNKAASCGVQTLIHGTKRAFPDLFTKLLHKQILTTDIHTLKKRVESSKKLQIKE